MSAAGGAGAGADTLSAAGDFPDARAPGSSGQESPWGSAGACLAKISAQGNVLRIVVNHEGCFVWHGKCVNRELLCLLEMSLTSLELSGGFFMPCKV